MCVVAWSYGAVAFVVASSSSRGPSLQAKSEKNAGLEYYFEKFEKDFDRKLVFVAVIQTVVPIFVMWALAHQETARVLAEKAAFEKKLPAFYHTLALFKDALEQ